MIPFVKDLFISRRIKVIMVFALAVIMAAGVCLPVSRELDRSKEALVLASENYIDAVAMADRFKNLQDSLGQKKSVLLREPLFSYTEKVARELKLESSLDYVRPENRTLDDGTVVEIVHIAFKGITLQEFTRFLFRIEVQNRQIFIDNISIKKDAKRNLNMQMTLQKRG